MGFFFNNPLAVIIFILFIGFAVVLVLPESRLRLVRLWCLDISLIALLLGVVSCLAFNQSMVGFQFLFDLNVGFFDDNPTFLLGADGLSMIFLLLTLFVFPVCFVSS